MAEGDPLLSQANFYSFTGDRRSGALGKRARGSIDGSEARLADEGSTILTMALRRTQTGLAARAQFGSREVPARFNSTEGQQ